VTLQRLPAGLPPDEAEKLRWQAFGHKHTSVLTSADGFQRFIAQRGFVLTGPQRGLQFPSALEAVVGRPLLGRSFEERTAELDAWRCDCVSRGRLHAAAVLLGYSTLSSTPFHIDFLALAADRDDLRKMDLALAKQRLGYDAGVVCEHLARSDGALTQAELEEYMQLRSQPGRTRLRRALGEAIRRFCVCEVFRKSPSGEVVVAYDLTARACAGPLAKACKIDPATARQRIATRYLRNVLVEGCHEMARVLGWPPDVTLATLRRLESRKIASEHPASRHNRWFFQANATDLLPPHSTPRSSDAPSDE